MDKTITLAGTRREQLGDTYVSPITTKTLNVLLHPMKNGVKFLSLEKIPEKKYQTQQKLIQTNYGQNLLNRPRKCTLPTNRFTVKLM